MTKYYGESVPCSNCKAGTYSGTGASSCTNCAAGKYSSAGASTCTPCVQGSIPNTSKSGCTACQPSGANGATGTTTAAGQSSCNASCGKRNVASWKTATWNSNNTVTNSCTANSCNANYKIDGTGCKLNNLTLTYIANGGSGAPAAYTYTPGSGSITLSTNRPTRPNHTFAGWSTTSTGAVSYLPGANYLKQTKNTTIYAVWVANTVAITSYIFFFYTLYLYCC